MDDELNQFDPTNTPVPRDLDEAYSLENHIQDALDPSKVDGFPGDPLDFNRVPADGGQLAASSQSDMDQFGNMLSVPDAPGDVEMPDLSPQQDDYTASMPANLASPIPSKASATAKPTPQSRAADRRQARQSRLAMNQTRAMLQQPQGNVRSGADDDEFTFPTQEADNDNASDKWGDLHKANSDFREAVITNAGIEASLLQEHIARLKSVTESLIRARY